MGPRKVHKLKLGKYLFIREFLTKEWSVAEEERGNVDTYDNASIDAVWDSFQHFLELNGYAPDFCSKILLGKLLHEAGVEKVKRGPRRRQKFYYFPLRPVKGSKAQAILASNSDARYDASTTSYRLKKVKPEYYTLSTQSLGRVSVGVLHDRSMSPEKYATKVLRRSLRRRTIRSGYCDPNFKNVEDQRSPSGWPVDSGVAERNGTGGEDSGFHTYPEELNASRLKAMESERHPLGYSQNLEFDNRSIYDARHHRPMNFQNEEFGPDESNLSALLAQSLSRLYDTDSMHDDSQFQQQNPDHLNWDKENDLCATYDDNCMKRLSFRSMNTSFQVENFASAAAGGGISRHGLASGNVLNYDEEFAPNASRMLASSRMTHFMFYGGHSEKFSDAVHNKKYYRNEWGVVHEPPHLCNPSTTAQNRSDAYSSSPEHSSQQQKHVQKPEEQKPTLKNKGNHNNALKITSRKRSVGESKHKHNVNSSSSIGNGNLLVIGDVCHNAEKSKEEKTSFKRPRGRPKGSKNKKKNNENLILNEHNGKLSLKLAEKDTKKSRKVQKPDSDNGRSSKSKILLNLNNKASTNDTELRENVLRNIPKKSGNKSESFAHVCQKTSKDLFVLNASYKTEGFARNETALGIDYCSPPPLPPQYGDQTRPGTQPLSSGPGVTDGANQYPSRSYGVVPQTSDPLDVTGQHGSVPVSRPLSSTGWDVSLTYA